MSTRRDLLLAAPALAAAAALPAAGASSEPDPALEAISEWRRLHLALEQESDANPDIEWQDLPSHDAEWKAMTKVCNVIPTTAEGLAAQLLFAFGIFGIPKREGDLDNPEDFTFEEYGDDLDGRVMRSMLAGARALARA